MSERESDTAVERMFPFVMRSRNIIVGRDTIWRARSRLHFVLITSDLSETSRAEILRDFAHYPIVQHYTSADLERFFDLHETKVIGFEKSGLAQSIYAGLKEFRINKPEVKPTPPRTGQRKTGGHKDNAAVDNAVKERPESSAGD